MLVPWLDTPNLFAEMDALRRQMDALFERSSGFAGGNGPVGGFDLREEEGQTVLTLDMPGLASKDVEVTFTNGQLAISAERTIDTPEGTHLRHRERRGWRFSRTLALPDTVDADKVEANLAHGVLTVRLPTKPEAKPRRIEIHG